MAEKSLIMGRIEGLSKTSFMALQKELEALFERVEYREEGLSIRSERKHDGLKAMLQKLCDRMAEGAYGSLLYVGGGRVAAIYLSPGRFMGKEYREPTPPDWWTGPSD